MGIQSTRQSSSILVALALFVWPESQKIARLVAEITAYGYNPYAK